MSYSFNVRGADKHEIDRLVGEKFSEIVVNQPVHEIDRNQTRQAVHGFTQMLERPAADQELSVSVAGSLSYSTDEGGRTTITASNMSVSAMLVQKGA